MHSSGNGTTKSAFPEKMKMQKGVSLGLVRSAASAGQRHN
jgi:hypothetical protein